MGKKTLSRNKKRPEKEMTFKRWIRGNGKRIIAWIFVILFALGTLAIAFGSVAH